MRAGLVVLNPKVVELDHKESLLKIIFIQSSFRDFITCPHISGKSVNRE
jgi:hypothetical protein